MKRDVHEAMCPLGAVNVMQLLEHNLHLLPIGRAHGDEVKTLYSTINLVTLFNPDGAAQPTYLGILDLIRGIGFKQMRHLGRSYWEDVQWPDFVNWCSSFEMRR